MKEACKRAQKVRKVTSIDVVSFVLKRFLGISAVVAAQEVMGRTKNRSWCSAFHVEPPLCLCVFELYSWTLRRDYRQKSQEASGYEAMVASIWTPQPSRLSLFERLLRGTLTLEGQFAPVKRLVSRDFLSPSFSSIKADGATYVYSFEGVLIDQFSFKTILRQVKNIN